jgi:hypothetical protein
VAHTSQGWTMTGLARMLKLDSLFAASNARPGRVIRTAAGVDRVDQLISQIARHLKLSRLEAVQHLGTNDIAQRLGIPRRLVTRCPADLDIGDSVDPLPTPWQTQDWCPGPSKVGIRSAVIDTDETVCTPSHRRPYSVASRWTSPRIS